MPQFLNGVGSVLENAHSNVHHPDAKVFLDAFLGNKLKKSDETGSFSVNPLTGDVEIESPGGFKLMASPVGRSVQGEFRFGGPDRTIKARSPQAALDAALGIDRAFEMGPVAPSAGRQEMEQQTEEYLKKNLYGYRFPDHGAQGQPQ